MTVLGPIQAISPSHYKASARRLASRTLRTIPVALPNEERHPYCSRVDLSTTFIYKQLLLLHYTARLTLVIHTKNLASNLEVFPFAARR